MTKQQTLEQLHSVYSRFCAWTREEVPEYMGGKLQQDIIDALLAAARAIDQLPDEPTCAHERDKITPGICARCGQVLIDVPL